MLSLKKSQLDQLVCCPQSSFEREQVFTSVYEAFDQIDVNKCKRLILHLTENVIAPKQKLKDIFEVNEWLSELEIMQETGVKCELETLYTFIGHSKIAHWITFLINQKL